MNDPDYDFDNEMTDEQDDAVDAFFANGDFLTPNEPNLSGSNFEHVWEDFVAAEQVHKANPQLHVYTVVTSNNEEYYVIPGKHYVNRDGYLFSRIDAGLGPDNELRIR